MNSFRMDWLDLLAVQGTLKSLLQHRSSDTSILRHSTFFLVQISHLYMTTGKTIALSRQTFVGKVMSLLLNTLSRLVVAFLPRSKCLLISWLQSPSAPSSNGLWKMGINFAPAEEAQCGPWSCSLPGNYHFPEDRQLGASSRAQVRLR